MKCHSSRTKSLPGTLNWTLEASPLTPERWDTYSKSPSVLHLSTHVQVERTNQDAVAAAIQAGSAHSVRCGSIRRPVERTECLVSRSSVTRRVFVRKGFLSGAKVRKALFRLMARLSRSNNEVTKSTGESDTYASDAIGCEHVVAVGDRCVACLDKPQMLRKSGDGRVWIEHDLGPVHAVHAPVQRMMTTVADVDRNASILGFKYGMAQLTFHVISRLFREEKRFEMLFSIS